MQFGAKTKSGHNTNQQPNITKKRGRAKQEQHQNDDKL